MLLEHNQLLNVRFEPPALPTACFVVASDEHSSRRRRGYAVAPTSPSRSLFSVPENAELWCYTSVLCAVWGRVRGDTGKCSSLREDLISVAS